MSPQAQQVPNMEAVRQRGYGLARGINTGQIDDVRYLTQAEVYIGGDMSTSPQGKYRLRFICNFEHGRTGWQHNYRFDGLLGADTRL